VIKNHEIHIDFLIIGQGIAGSLLAWYLLKGNHSIKIIDDYKLGLGQRAFQSISAKKNIRKPAIKNLLNLAGEPFFKLKNAFGVPLFGERIPGGLITPITGKRLQKTWLADTLLPYAYNFYRNLQETLRSTFFETTPIVRIFADARQANEWSARCVSPELSSYIFEDYTFTNKAVNSPFGYTVFKQGAVIDGSQLLRELRFFFEKHNLFINDTFWSGDLRIDKSYIHWKNIKARAVIFCEGWKAMENPLFNWLPFMPSKGELLIIKSPDLQLNHLINRGIFIRPLSGEYYLVGSTYAWDDLTLKPTGMARDELSTKLKSLINMPFKVVDQIVGIRPTVYNRRPFLGQHPQHENVFIFNGLGTKGLLLSPYFSRHMGEYLQGSMQLLADVNIQRFEKKYFNKN
jgi:glycine oxidase